MQQKIGSISSPPREKVAERTIVITNKVVSRPYGLTARLEYADGRTNHRLVAIDVWPLPVNKPTVLTNLGLAYAFGLVANLSRSRPELQTFTLHNAGPVHEGWLQIAALASRLSGLAIVLEAPTFTNEQQGGPDGPVIAISGGKDSLYAAERMRHKLAGHPAVYLGAGFELNWPNEVLQVDRYVDHFGLVLQEMAMGTAYYTSSATLRFAVRAVWRELVGLVLCRCFGHEIVTGINIDAVATLEVVSGTSGDYLGQLLPALRALEEILGASISTLPGELEVYADIRSHPLFDPAGSCFTDCDPGDPCSKCSVFAVYEKVLAGEHLDAADRVFIDSERYIGDAALLRHPPA